MLAKSLKIADGRRVTKTLNTGSRSLQESEPDGGTAWTKRTQGSEQAVGRIAPSRGLKQPRKCEMCEADPVTSRGRQHPPIRFGKDERVPPGSRKIVACSQRSEYR